MKTTNEEQALEAAPASTSEDPQATTKPNTAPRKPRVAPAKAKASMKAATAKKAAKAPKQAKSAKAEGKATPAKAEGVREDSKTATVLALIQRAKGATLAELMEATSWQAHSVRGFISGTLGKKMALTVNSAKREDGERVYSIAK